ncbi:hypothetical protein [Sporocytophaga myxococcoides]|uniref:hypothetical protein n=1 Tax=Sporocytophaga myxococcoides TaxID=153721 RepID=UPI00048F490C|nr:hypothetical protein [Sporocytophaga myxococcoides]
MKHVFLNFLFIVMAGTLFQCSKKKDDPTPIKQNVQNDFLELAGGSFSLTGQSYIQGEGEYDVYASLPSILSSIHLNFYGDIPAEGATKVYNLEEAFSGSVNINTGPSSVFFADEGNVSVTNDSGRLIVKFTNLTITKYNDGSTVTSSLLLTAPK